MWDYCYNKLESELPEQDFNAWIQPLQAIEEAQSLRLLAPNQYVEEAVQEKFLPRICEIVLARDAGLRVSLAVGSIEPPQLNQPNTNSKRRPNNNTAAAPLPIIRNNLDPRLNFDDFVEGKSNAMAKAAALQVAENPGGRNNPLFIYGATGLGKTHLMNAVGNTMLKTNPATRVVYLHAERFVNDMVKALRQNTIDDFKVFYRSANTLLIDDIQFLAGKERSQEEFFHTLNSLLESKRQVILTCDRYPREVEKLDKRLQSRLGWGLTVAIDPPELETRQAILNSKAEQIYNIEIPNEVSFFVAEKIRSNVRELEGALCKIMAHAEFTGSPITIEQTKQALHDLLVVQGRMVTIENIQKTVAEYYRIRISDLSGKSRRRSIVRPRQMAMAMAKMLTNHSLPEIGSAFGGRDHTTVLHACRKIDELKERDNRVKDDYQNLHRLLTT